MSRGTEQTFFQRKHVNSLQGHEKVLSLITNLEKGMATHPSIRACRIPLTGEPGRLQTMRSQRVRHDPATITNQGKCKLKPL